MPVTMQDLAHWLKISKSTVSRALAGDPRVSCETRARVQHLARELNYHPNTAASGLARRRTNVIGLVIPFAPRSLSDPFFLEFVGGIGDFAITKGFSILLSSPKASQDGSGSDTTFSKIVSSRRVDGLILTEPKVADERVDFLKERDIPFVFLGNPGRNSDIYWVDGDNKAGVEMAVDHLVALGHRDIACIAGPPDQTATFRRLEGYRAALGRHGIPYDGSRIAEGDFTEPGGYRAMMDILDRSPGITAVVGSNDMMAIGAMNAARQRGLRVPEDLSVVGFDGIALGAYVTPALTTVTQPIYRLGQAAAELLIKLVERHIPAERHVLFPLTLTVRESSARRQGAAR
ncbi:MAG: LacI family DNA-binding transcriptional regulator [Bacillota bacterium]